MENTFPKVFKKIQQLISGGSGSTGVEEVAAQPSKVSKAPAPAKAASASSSVPIATKKAPTKGLSAAASSASSSNAYVQEHRRGHRSVRDLVHALFHRSIDE